MIKPDFKEILKDTIIQIVTCEEALEAIPKTFTYGGYTYELVIEYHSDESVWNVAYEARYGDGLTDIKGAKLLNELVEMIAWLKFRDELDKYKVNE